MIMKRFLIGIVAALLLIAGSGEARAEDGTSVSVGIKMWLNEWIRDQPGGSITSDTTVLFGPAFELKIQRVFVEASYLFATSDYSFPDGTSFDREDLDVAVGYRIIPEFGFLVGYRNTILNERFTGLKDTFSGPLIGIVGNAYMNPQVSLYGRLAYLFTELKEESSLGSFHEDSPGWTMEFGIKVAFTRAFAGSFGYRYDTSEGNTSNVRDSFSGLTFSGMASF
jgi:opacity protein-like surface antigen